MSWSNLHRVPNDLRLVRVTTDRLLSERLDVWLAGGWAEELHGMTAPRTHHDIDLLCRADSFDAVDDWLRRTRGTEINAKRFPHKRAFEVADTMVEVILVRPDLRTHFWGTHQYSWPSDTFGDVTGRPPLISTNALRHYRTNRPPTQPTPER